MEIPTFGHAHVTHTLSCTCFGFGQLEPLVPSLQNLILVDLPAPQVVEQVLQAVHSSHLMSSTKFMKHEIILISHRNSLGIVVDSKIILYLYRVQNKV